MDDNIQEAKIRGTIVGGLKDYLIKTYGDESFHKIISKMKPENEKIVSGSTLGISYFSSDFLKEFEYAITSVLPKGNTPKITEAMRLVSHTNLNTAMSIFMKIGSQHFIAQRFPQIWKFFFTQGELSLVEDTNGSVSILLKGHDNYGEVICNGSVGWMQGAIEKSGGKEVTCVHT